MARTVGRGVGIWGVVGALLACGTDEGATADTNGSAESLHAVTGAEAYGQPAAQAAPAQAAPAAASDAPLSAEHKTLIVGYIRKLMDEPHMTEGNRGLRGEAGEFAKLSAAQVDEFAATIAYCADHFMPQQLTFEQRAAIVAAQISAESAFQVETSAPNPGNVDGQSVRSVGVLQVTPQIWVPCFRQRCDVAGLHHYDGSPWVAADTSEESMSTSIWDNAVVASWAVKGQALSGAANPRAREFGESPGPCPNTPWIGQYCWVAGYPAAQKGGDLANQRDNYRAMIRSGIQFLGQDPGIIDQSYPPSVATN